MSEAFHPELDACLLQSHSVQMPPAWQSKGEIMPCAWLHCHRAAQPCKDGVVRRSCSGAAWDTCRLLKFCMDRFMRHSSTAHVPSPAQPLDWLCALSGSRQDLEQRCKAPAVPGTIPDRSMHIRVRSSKEAQQRMRRRKKRRREKARKGAQGEAEADGVQANGHGPAEADEAVEAEDEEELAEAADELVLMQVRFCFATVVRAAVPPKHDS